jgi:hypothetical protein
MARVAPVAAATRSDQGSPKSLPLRAAIRIRASGCRPALRTVEEAIDMIDKELPAELRRLPRWTFARALLEEALRTRRNRDLTAAARQLVQALSNEKWLAEDQQAGG